MLKKMVIHQLTKLKVSHSMPGRIRFKMSSLKMIPEQYMAYEKFLKQAIKKLNGVENIEINNLTGSILITYDINKLYEKKLLKWIDIVREIGIKNYDLIEKYGESNLNYVVKTIEQQLDENLKTM
ncbi:HMA2 domain-containing protein [Eubacterium multiforme]|uniref:Copper chaperone CopZ n=1 Tax=Eubacterium multiforme TaxID=83339 RepID=A0ABT9UXU8_9FIRM|nr:cation transporter [Eubacterium multiforme]MDQ0151074.1 copper chaperone CopZ [Eubacterium multiforme]